MPTDPRAARTRRFACFEVDLSAGELRRQGLRIRLEDQPFQVLSSLLERPGELVTREELRRRLWPDQTYVDFDRRLNVAVARLRAALGDSGDSPRYVETLYKRGYRLLVPVHDQGGGEPSPAPRRWRRPLLLSAFALVLLGGLVLAGLRPSHPPATGRSPRAAVPRRSVAVLGFKNLSGDPRHAWLTTALSEWLATELQAGEHLRTIPAQRVARLEIELSVSGLEATAPEGLSRIRDNLGTDLVVAGSYARLGPPSGGQIRLDLRLLEAQGGETVAVLSETGVEGDVSGLVSRAGAGLRAKLGLPPITLEEQSMVTATVPSDADAARHYSEALGKLRWFDALAARDLLQKAIAAEPGYAPAHSALATAWAELGYDRQAKEAAQRAFDLSPALPRTERLRVKGRYHEMSHDWIGAADVYRALFQFFPDNLEYGLALAEAQVSGNRWKDVLATVAALRELPAPLRDDPRIDLVECIAARSSGDSRRAESAGARAVDRARALGASLTLAKARVDQAWEFKTRGRTAEADEAAREAERIYRAAGHRAGAARAATVLGTVLHARGDHRGAHRMYQEALHEYRQIGHQRGMAVEHVNIGSLLLDLGQPAEARRSFEAALAAYSEAGDPGGLTLAKLGLGRALFELGDHRAARHLTQESLDGARQAGDRNRAAKALLTLGELLWLQGEGDAARSTEQEALAIFGEVGTPSEAARAELVLAEILLGQGQPAEAEVRARSAAAHFGRVRNAAQQRRAQALAARAALVARPGPPGL